MKNFGYTRKPTKVIGEGSYGGKGSTSTKLDFVLDSIPSVEGETSVPIVRKRKVKKSTDAAKSKALQRAVFGGTSQFTESNFQELIASKKNSESKEQKEEVAAWVDSEDEDENVPIDVKVARKFLSSATSASITKWASEPAPEYISLKESDENAYHSDNDLGTTSEKIMISKSQFKKLAPNKIGVSKCRDLNQSKPNSNAINCTQFHKTDRVALVGSADTTLSLFRVDGDENKNIAQIPFENFPIHFAEFISNSKTVFLTSIYNSFYSYDYGAMNVTAHHGLRCVDEKIFSKFTISNCGKFIAMKGMYGKVYLIISHSLELIKTLTLNDYVEGMTFTSDSGYFLASDCKGKVYVFDLRKLTRCLRKFEDEGSTNTISVALSSDSSLLACGSFNGVLNLYDFQSILAEVKRFPEPVKCFKNLTTLVDNVKFSSTNEYCVFSSRLVKNSVKIAHMDSFTVFEDFPTYQNLGCVKTFDLSPHGKYLTFGSISGKCRLYDVTHYSRY